MSIQIVEIAQPSVIDTVAVAQPSTVAVVEIRQGPAGTGGGGSNSVTSATTSDGTADLDLLNVTTATAEVTGTLTANHIHGNLAGSVYAHVRAGEALLKGDPVYVSGFNNGTSTAEVMKADASNAAKMPAIGIMDANLAHNATGHMVVTGVITDVNTAGYAVNAELYVNAGGGMTATPPTARAQPVARVERVNANNGAIIVKVNGLSASDATPSTLVRRDASGGANFAGTVNLNTGVIVDLQFEDYQAAVGATFTYGAGADAAHRTALGGTATGVSLFTAATPAAALTTLGGGTAATGTGAVVLATSPTLAGGSLATDVSALSVTGTLPNSASQQFGVKVAITPTGSVAATIPTAMSSILNAGYTGAGFSIGMFCANATAGTGTGGLLGNPANYGLYNQASGATSGHNIGVLGLGQNSSSLNVGALGACNQAGPVNVGVAGSVNAGTVRVGGFFSLRTTAPAYASAALIADNGAVAAPILLLRDNGTDVFVVADGGNVSISATTASTSTTTGALVVSGGAGIAGAVNSLYQRVGSGTPEGVVTAPVGAVFHRTDGGAGTSFYVKESGTGNTGWVGK